MVLINKRAEAELPRDVISSLHFCIMSDIIINKSFYKAINSERPRLKNNNDSNFTFFYNTVSI